MAGKYKAVTTQSRAAVFAVRNGGIRYATLSTTRLTCLNVSNRPHVAGQPGLHSTTR